MDTINPKVLLVDDDISNNKATRRVLMNLGCYFDAAINGEDAISLLNSYEYAVAIFDIKMPGMDGFELASKALKTDRNHNLPIIFLTGEYLSDEDIEKGYKLGAVDYLMKPCNSLILKSKVQVFINLYNMKMKLQDALKEVNVLSGYLPICSYCHNVKDDEGYWQQVEEYISSHSELMFSHGLCPDCLEREFPDANIERDKKLQKDGQSES